LISIYIIQLLNSPRLWARHLVLIKISVLQSTRILIRRPLSEGSSVCSYSSVVLLILISPEMISKIKRKVK